MHNPFVPETLEGWSVLHHMYRVDWPRIQQLSKEERSGLADEASRLLAEAGNGHTGVVQLLGHKADLMVIYFRKTFDELGQCQLNFSRTKLNQYLTMTTSYVSIVELGMYEMTSKIHQQLAERGLKSGTSDFDQAFEDELAQQQNRMSGRLFPEIPERRYVCFYPMNKKRGEEKNWYREAFDRRSEMMLEHGIVGRHYAGRVTQIISGSIGFDDWEWGVDLFADDPLVFKKLIYEMRFDEASAVYAEFGPFYIGLQFRVNHFEDFLEGRTPQL
ncbi:MAG TPA: hydrogen peroxide-dependent heme synthase [Acidobacteriota bacterium]|nr:hydrogen peroxide-dependent heme synthase [Acidobacteriota bacterium]